MRSKLDWALHWAARGFAVFPCEEGGKAPVTNDGFKSATKDHGQITRWWRRDPNANIGLWTDGFTLIDVDVRNGQQGIASLLDLQLEVPELCDPTLTVRTPSGGMHLYFKSEPSRNSHNKLGAGLDTRGHRGYALAAGSELTGEGPYVIEVDAPPALLPESVFALLARPRDENRVEVEAADNGVDIEAAREFLEAAKPAIEGLGGDNDTYRIICAVRDFGVTEDTAFELLLENWNERCEPPWGFDELKAKVGNAYRYAENTAGVKSVADAYADLDLPVEEPAKHTPLQWAGVMPQSEAAWLVYEKIPRNGTGMLVAPSRAGKTFLALKLAECLAAGDAFFREKPDERCGTLILSAEGNHGLGRRLGALAKLPVAGLAIGALDTPQALRALYKSIEAARDELKERFGVRLGLIVLDTLSASLLVQDENSNSDMARAFARLTQMADKFDCFALATHHTPKGSTGARGAGASFNAADLVIEIFRKGEEAVRSVECMKNKDGPEGKWGSFTLQTVTVGYDAKGRPKTTCLVSMGGIVQVEREVEGPSQLDALMQAFDAARADNNLTKYQPVPREMLRRAFNDTCPLKSARQAYGRVLKYALDHKLIAEEGDNFNDNPAPIESED